MWQLIYNRKFNRNLDTDSQVMSELTDVLCIFGDESGHVVKLIGILSKDNLLYVCVYVRARASVRFLTLISSPFIVIASRRH